MATNMRGSLDTNTLLRLSLGDIPTQALLVKKLLDESLYLEVVDAVMFEVIFVMEKKYNLSREQIVKNALTIIRHSKISSNRILFEAVLPQYLRNQKLSIIDCALVQYAKLNKTTPLYTFNQTLAKANPGDTHLLIAHD